MSLLLLLLILFVYVDIFSIRSLNHDFLSDVSWTISMYLESVAMVPQLYMFQKQASEQGGIVEASRIVRTYDVDIAMMCVSCISGADQPYGVCAGHLSAVRADLLVNFLH